MDEETTLTYEDAINRLDQADSSDEEDIYDAEPDEFKSPTNVSNLRMFEDNATFRPGGTKADYKGSQTGQIVHQYTSSDCTVSIERLVWVDGWRGQPDKDGKDEAMTLAVLKLGFQPEDDGAKVVYASVQLKLKADKQDGNDPQLVAWGPFRRPEMWNVTDTHKRTSVTPSIQFSGGGAGQQVTVGISRTKEVTWDELHTDYGLSSAKSDSKNSKQSTPTKDRAPNTVKWQVFENKLLGRGITPEIRVAALFSRPEPSNSSNQNYRVVVKIVAHLSHLGQKVLRVLRRVGYQGADTVKWTVEARPLQTDRSYAEGLDIIKHIDPAKLGELVDPKDRTNLDPQWLNKWDRFETAVPIPAAATATASVTTAATDSTPAIMAEVTAIAEPPKAAAPYIRHVALEEEQTTRGLPNEPVHRAAQCNPSDYVQHETRNSGGPRVPISVDASIHMRDDSDDENADQSVNTAPAARRHSVKLRNNISISRLVELEKRAARAEDRIADQEQRILELQRTLTRVAQVLLVPSLHPGLG